MSIDDATLALGKTNYETFCKACHGEQGQGVPMLAPPLAGSEWVVGPIDNVIRMQFRGLKGPITVKGKAWDGAPIMMPMGPAIQGDDNATADEKIAAVITYIRNSWGNEASEVNSEQVAKWRYEIGQDQLTVEDLLDPFTPVVSNTGIVEVAPLAPGEINPIAPESSINTTGVLAGLGVAAWCIICLIPVIKGALTK